jgi:hypothetical protein
MVMVLIMVVALVIVMVMMMSMVMLIVMVAFHFFRELKSVQGSFSVGAKSEKYKMKSKEVKTNEKQRDI